ncbi:hypothetical protein [Pseudomonas sp. URIL14HWK12:I9]|uniref:hypothetical protein n=2 Tax=Pseudomonas TaxID=286 RepID=UPI0015968B61|nr:hypothetical protein [Pseudomonas sp. URIL14HWK12:I9]
MLTMNPRMVLGSYDGVVRVDDEGAWILLSIAKAVPERIECLRWIRADEVLELRPNPVGDQSPYLRPRLSDADSYAAALALLDYWAEVGEQGEKVDDLALLVGLAPFYQCPACEANPLRIDDCTLCAGAGFVWEGVAPP